MEPFLPSALAWDEGDVILIDDDEILDAKELSFVDVIDEMDVRVEDNGLTTSVENQLGRLINKEEKNFLQPVA